MPSGEANRLTPCHTRGIVGMGRWFMGIEDYGAMRCRCCDAVDENTSHARMCPRAGAQVNQHRPLVHAMSCTLKRLGIRRQMESGEPFTVDRNLRMYIVVRREGLRDPPNREYRNMSILLDVTHADPRAQIHLRAVSADHDGSAASTSEDARPGHVSFEEGSHKLATLAVESFGRLGVEGSKFIDQLAACVVGAWDGGSIGRKGVVEERLLQIVPVTTEVAISRRVSRFKLQLRGRQE